MSRSNLLIYDVWWTLCVFLCARVVSYLCILPLHTAAAEVSLIAGRLDGGEALPTPTPDSWTSDSANEVLLVRNVGDGVGDGAVHKW